MIGVSLCALEMTHFYKRGVRRDCCTRDPGYMQAVGEGRAREVVVVVVSGGTLSHVHQPFRGDLVIKES